MSKYAGQRPWHSGEIKRMDEQRRVPDLPAAAASHETPELFLARPSVPRRLLLESAERPKLSLSVDDLPHGGGTDTANQLVLQLLDAHVETECFHIGASEVRAEAGLLESPPVVALLSGVAEARQPDVEPLRAEQVQEAPDGLRTANWDNGNAFGAEIPTTSLSEGLERQLVADPFDEHDRTRVDACGARVCRGEEMSTPIAARRFDIGPV